VRSFVLGANIHHFAKIIIIQKRILFSFTVLKKVRQKTRTNFFCNPKKSPQLPAI
jgi:hypothetical protein